MSSFGVSSLWIILSKNFPSKELVSVYIEHDDYRSEESTVSTELLSVAYSNNSSSKEFEEDDIFEKFNAAGNQIVLYNSYLSSKNVYVLEDQIARKRLCTIYSARNSNNGQLYALKRCKQKSNCFKMQNEYNYITKLMLSTTKKLRIQIPLVYNYTENSNKTECLLMEDLITDSSELIKFPNNINISTASNLNTSVSLLIHCFGDVMNSLSIFHTNNLFLNDLHERNILYKYNDTNNRLMCYLIDFENIFDTAFAAYDYFAYYGPIRYFSAYGWYKLLNVNRRNKLTVNQINYFAKMDNIYSLACVIMDTFIKLIIDNVNSTILIVNKSIKNLKKMEKKIKFLRYNMHLSRKDYINSTSYLPPWFFQQIWYLRRLMVQNIYLIINNTNISNTFSDILSYITQHYEWNIKQEIITKKNELIKHKTNNDKEVEVWLISTIGFNSSYLLIPYFISWYSALGIKSTNFLLNINFNYSIDDISSLNKLIIFLNQSNIINYEIWTGGYTSKTRTFSEIKWLNRTSKNDYILITDVDEFQEWNYFGVYNICEFVNKKLIPSGNEYVSGYMIDRFAPNASLIDPESIYRYNNTNYTKYIDKLFEQYPLMCSATKEIVGGYINKIVLFRNIYHVQNGRHSVERKEKYNGTKLEIYKGKDEGYESILRYKNFKVIINHFKWNMNVIKYLRKRAKYTKTQNITFWHENILIADWLEKNAGKLNIENNNKIGCSENIKDHLHINQEWHQELNYYKLYRF